MYKRRTNYQNMEASRFFLFYWEFGNSRVLITEVKEVELFTQQAKSKGLTHIYDHFHCKKDFKIPHTGETECVDVFE